VVAAAVAMVAVVDAEESDRGSADVDVAEAAGRTFFVCYR